MDLATIVIHIAKDLIATQALVQTIAVGLGIGYCAHATMQAIKKSAAPDANSVISGKKIFASFFIGALIVNFSAAMSNVWASMTGEQRISYGMVSYVNAPSIGQLGPVINAILTIVSTFGWWYGLKGWILLRKASTVHSGSGGGYEDDGWRGFIHILGGAAMINITATLDAFKETVGLTF